MDIAAFNLKTLRQARGCMPSNGTGERRLAILKVLCDRDAQTLHDIAAAFNMSTNAVAGTINCLVNEKLISRQGSVGKYRYSITGKGRTLCD